MSIASVKAAIAAWVEAASGQLSHWAGQNHAPPPVPFVGLRLIGLDSVGQDWADVQDNPLVLADDAVESVDAGADTLTLTAHAYQTGDGPVRLTTTGAAPGGTAPGLDYWLIRTSANAVKLARSHYDARHGVAVDITDAGTGTHTIVDTADTVRSGAEIKFAVRGTRIAALSIQCYGASSAGAVDPLTTLEAIRLAASAPVREQSLNTAGIGLASFGDVQEIDHVVGLATFEPRAIATVMLHLAAEAFETAGIIEHVNASGDVDGAAVDGPGWIPSDPAG